MSFIIWHLLAICSVMAVSFGIGVWYSSYRATVNKPEVRWTSDRGVGIEDKW